MTSRPQRFLLAAALALTAMLASCKAPLGQATPAPTLLILGKEAVHIRLNSIQSGIAQRLSSFAHRVVHDELFAMKLLVENDPRAPAITDIAGHYMNPMGFSTLTLTDDKGTVLSCGQFPASAGNPSPATIQPPDEQTRFAVEKIKGRDELCLQARIPCSIEGKELVATGGIVTDESFLRELIPFSSVKLLLKHNQETLTTFGSVQTVSTEIKDHIIFVNNISYFADTIALPFAGSAPAPVLMVLVEKKGG